MAHPALQPNIVAAGTIRGYSLTFWLLVVVIGVGAGLGAGVLMALLHAVQHLA